MARPRKEGLQYFPLDCELDEKVKILESVHGNDGFTWIIKTWQKAYRENTGEIDLNGAFGVFHAENCRITVGKQFEIIKTCLEIHALYEISPQIYSSNGIQKRISEVTKRRENDRNRKENELSDGKQPENVWKRGEKEKEKEIKKETEYLFEVFWKAYPKKKAKGDSIKAWEKIKSPRETLALILDVLKWQIKTFEWTKDDGQYIPYPATYLNQQRWTDEPDKLPETGRKFVC